MRERFYSTAELARICGVSISTIKRWTDAGLLRCVRTPGGHRKFRLQDVAEAARRLETSTVVPETSGTARYDELTLLLLQQSREALATRVAETLVQGDAPGSCRWLVDLHRHGMASHRIAGEVLWAALSRIRSQGTDDYQLRRAQGLAEAAVRNLAAQLPPPLAQAPRALLAQPPGKSSTLWLGFALLVLREAGWSVVDLGAQVPLQTLHLGVVQEQPDLVVLSVGERSESERELLRRGLPAMDAAVWLLPETAESLAALAAKLQARRLQSEIPGTAPIAGRDAKPEQAEEIFSLSRRLS